VNQIVAVFGDYSRRIRAL